MDKKNKKGFTLSMLITRWKKPKEEVISLLTKNNVPGHINHNDIDFNQGMPPIEYAFFFEEYIYAAENKNGITHNKLKSRFYKRK